MNELLDWIMREAYNHFQARIAGRSDRTDVDFRERLKKAILKYFSDKAE